MHGDGEQIKSLVAGAHDTLQVLALAGTSTSPERRQRLARAVHEWMGMNSINHEPSGIIHPSRSKRVASDSSTRADRILYMYINSRVQKDSVTVHRVSRNVAELTGEVY